MLNSFRASCKESAGVSLVQQDYKPFKVILEEYLNGNVSIPQTDKGSYQFAQEGDVDFNAEGINNHHDIFSVASGADPVFPDVTPVEPVSASPASSPSPEVSNE